MNSASVSRERFLGKSGFARKAGVNKLKDGFAGLEALNTIAGFLKNKLASLKKQELTRISN